MLGSDLLGWAVKTFSEALMALGPRSHFPSPQISKRPNELQTCSSIYCATLPRLAEPKPIHTSRDTSGLNEADHAWPRHFLRSQHRAERCTPGKLLCKTKPSACICMTAPSVA